MEKVDGYRRNIEDVLAAAEDVGATAAWSEIADHLATHLQQRAVYGEARSLLERALGIDEKTFARLAFLHVVRVLRFAVHRSARGRERLPEREGSRAGSAQGNAT